MDVNFSKNINIGLPPEMQSSKNTLFEVFLLILVCVLFSWFILIPKNSAVNLKKSELAKYELEQKTMAENLSTMQALVADLKQHGPDVQKLDQALPLDAENIPLQLAIQDLANNLGVSVGDITLTGENGSIVAGDTQLLADPFGAGRSLKQLSGTVYVIGSFPQLTGFLRSLETSARTIQISSLQVGGGQDNSLSLKVTFSAYYLAP